MWCQIVVAETAKISMEISILMAFYVSFGFKVEFLDRNDFKYEFLERGKSNLLHFWAQKWGKININSEKI